MVRTAALGLGVPGLSPAKGTAIPRLQGRPPAPVGASVGGNQSTCVSHMGVSSFSLSPSPSPSSTLWGTPPPPNLIILLSFLRMDLCYHAVSFPFFQYSFIVTTFLCDVIVKYINVAVCYRPDSMIL